MMIFYVSHGGVCLFMISDCTVDNVYVIYGDIDFLLCINMKIILICQHLICW